MRTKQLCTLGLLALICAVMAGCTMGKKTENHEMNTGSKTTQESKKDHKKHIAITSEFQFLSEMIPHHQEAITTSLIVNKNTAFTPLRNLTLAIASAQTQEVEIMKVWLNQWYSWSVYTGTYENMMPMMVGVIGEMRDRAYMNGMIGHHMTAIIMAQQALKLELHPEVKAFAENVVKVQSTEIEVLTNMLINYK